MEIQLIGIVSLNLIWNNGHCCITSVEIEFILLELRVVLSMNV